MPREKTDRATLDYHDTALRLQKEWDREDPQQLPFAPHVTNHALVSILNKGLLYNACERETLRVRNHPTMAQVIIGHVIL